MGYFRGVRGVDHISNFKMLYEIKNLNSVC